MVISAAVSAPATVAVAPTTVITSAAVTTPSATASTVPIASIIICKGRGCGQEGVRREERYEESSREQGAADCPENDMQ